MKNIFCTVFSLCFVLISGRLLAQNKDANDFIIELPLAVNEAAGKLEIDDIKWQQIKQNRNRCKYFIIEDINSPKQKKTEIKQFLQNLNPNELPFMAGIIDTIAFLISDKRIEKTLTYLIFVGLDEALEVKYIYSTLNNEETHPYYSNILFSDNEQFKSINIAYGQEVYDFILLNPFYENRIRKLFFETKNPGKFQLTITTGIPNGTSTMRYQPDTMSYVSAVYYDTKIVNGFAVQLQTFYSIRRFLIGSYIRYENYNFEDATRIIITRKTGGGTNLNYSGSGNWPEQLLYFGIAVAYDFLILEKFVFTPEINAGSYLITGSKKKFDPTFNSSANTVYKNRYNLGGSANVKFLLYGQLWITLGASFQYNYIDAQSYFIDIKPDSYHMHQEVSRLDIGLSYNF
ncbi:MAG: hypothetical protein P1P88_20330 [Bacteroidales bacterium]|nr:hypothetical protein [Bacteroidales bacterium]